MIGVGGMIDHKQLFNGNLRDDANYFILAHNSLSSNYLTYGTQPNPHTNKQSFQ
jgi:hypothetical protein